MTHCATSPTVAGSIPDGVTRIFYYGPVIDSASNRNEYQEYIPAVKSGRSVRLQPRHLHVTTV